MDSGDVCGAIAFFYDKGGIFRCTIQAFRELDTQAAQCRHPATATDILSSAILMYAMLLTSATEIAICY